MLPWKPKPAAWEAAGRASPAAGRSPIHGDRWVPTPGRVQRDPTGLGVSRDTTLGCPHGQEGLVEVAGLTRLAEGTGVSGHGATVPQWRVSPLPPLSQP